MWAVTEKEAREIDRAAAAAAGVSEAELMDRAGRALARACGLQPGERAVIFAGKGKNGGDGYLCARALLEAGVTVDLLAAGEPKGEASAAARAAFLAAGGTVCQVEEPLTDGVRARCAAADVIVDALLGVGLTRPVSGVYRELIMLANALPARKIAADIPSGLDADEGRIWGGAFRADETVTFFACKRGMALPLGKELCGRITCCLLGIPEETVDRAAEAAGVTTHTGSAGLVARALPERDPFTHKGSYGRVLIIAGSRGYTGAAWLSSMAAVRGGAGVVSCGVPESVWPIVAGGLHSPVVFPLPDDGKGRLAASAAAELADRSARCDACLIGPGLSVSEALPGLLETVMSACTAPLVIDADGLNALAGKAALLAKAAGPVILTPHAGEFARLRGAPVDRDERAGRYVDAAARFAAEHGVVLVHKGHVTAVAAPDGRLYLNNTGNPGMAKGGSGDILAGLLLALLGQGAEPFMAAAAAVYLHGAAGDAARARYSERTLAPEDLLDALALSGF